MPSFLTVIVLWIYMWIVPNFLNKLLGFVCNCNFFFYYTAVWMREGCFWSYSPNVFIVQVSCHNSFNAIALNTWSFFRMNMSVLGIWTKVWKAWPKSSSLVHYLRQQSYVTLLIWSPSQCGNKWKTTDMLCSPRLIETTSSTIFGVSPFLQTTIFSFFWIVMFSWH